MGKQDFRLLLEKYLKDGITAEELKHLNELLHSGKNDADLEALIDETLSAVPAATDHEIAATLFNRISTDAKAIENDTDQKAPVIAANRKGIKKVWGYAAAAVIIIMITTFSFWYQGRRGDVQISAVVDNPKDIAPPDAAKAVITLSNGQNIILDSAANGMVAVQGNASVVKTTDGQIVYSAKGKAPVNHQLLYNTLTVPKGSKVVSVTLSDGTAVWLNAASSLRYPVVFTGNDRKVSITGEVYFEVAKDRSRQFIVEANGISTKVLGTHFNINAYEDEPETRITLLEGAVKIGSRDSEQMLAPGQQAMITPGGNIHIDANTDIEEVMAWKDGRFQFGGADIQEVMREVMRWYNVEIEYEGDIRQHFRGGISRNVEASKVFKMLEATGTVHFKIADKKIIVTP
jgi:ferric-dicitrate binding protein FerR (iron transport regulator)